MLDLQDLKSEILGDALTGTEQANFYTPDAITMLDRVRLGSIQNIFEKIYRNGIEGDLVETGVWRGGASIFMAGLLKAYGGRPRRLWACDSFKGFPDNSNTRLGRLYPQELHIEGRCAVSLDEVTKNFKRFDLLNGRVSFLRGWFEDTVGPTSKDCPIKKIALLRFDGDMFTSVVEVLDGLYDKISHGGYVIIDDYCITGCYEGLMYWLKKRKLHPMLIDPYTGERVRKNRKPCGVYWRVIRRKKSNA